MRILYNRLPAQPSSLETVWVCYGPNEPEPFSFDGSMALSEWIEKKTMDGICFDLVLHWLPEVWEVPKGMDRVPIPSVAIISDWNLNYCQTLQALDVFDLILVDRRGAELLRSKYGTKVVEFNAYGLHTAALEARCQDGLAGQNFTSDVLFIGNLVPGIQKERGRWLRRLLRLSQQCDVRIETGLWGEAYDLAMRSAKVVFNRSIRGEANMRFFETIACNGPVLFQESTNLEASAFLQPGTDFLTYDDAIMEEQLLGILADEPKRLQIIRNSRIVANTVSAASRWVELYRVLARFAESWSTQVITQRKSMDEPEMLWQLLWCSKRTTSLDHINHWLAKILQGSVSAKELSIALAILSRSREPNQSTVEIATDVVERIGEKRLSIWDRIHWVFLLQRSEEICLDPKQNADFQIMEQAGWQGILNMAQTADLNEFPNAPLLLPPHPRCYDLQASLWNSLIPGSFLDVPDFRTLLMHWANHRLGEICISLQQLEQAGIYMQEALHAYSGHAHSWFLMHSMPLANKLNPQQIMIGLQTAFDLDPLHPEYGMALLYALIEAGYWEQCRLLCFELIALHPLQFQAYQVPIASQKELVTTVQEIAAKLDLLKGR